MIVIYNDDFLEKLRRPSNVVTIGSYSLDYIAPSEIKSNKEDADSFSREILSIENYTNKHSEIQGFWEPNTNSLKLRIDLPEEFLKASNEINIIRFYDTSKELVFLVISDTDLNSLNSSLSQTRNLFNIPIKDVQASIEVVNTSDDSKFLKSYGADLGSNIYRLDNDGNVMITKESFYKMFSIRDMEDTELYVQNDTPTLDKFGRKINHNYTYRIYKNLNIFCSGLDTNCWIPTKFDLYRRDGSRLEDDPIPSIDFCINGGIRLYGTADYEEYQVLGETETKIGTGTATIESIPGLKFDEVENTGISYNINYKNLTFDYIKPEETDPDMNAAVILKASLINSDGSIIESAPIRFYQGGRTDEWKLISKTTTYFETVNRVDIPVFLFKYNADLYEEGRKSTSSYRHRIRISTTLKIERPEDLIITFENERLEKYFNIKCGLTKIYDDLDDTIVKQTIIDVTLSAKQRNNNTAQWWPVNEKGESTLYKATIGYDNYSTDFYMVQSPKVKGLSLYEFNPVGAYFSPIQSIEFTSIERSKVYWMMADEKTLPTVQSWWRSSYIEYPDDPATKGDLNASLGITVQGVEYLGKNTFKTKKESEIKKYPEDPKILGYGFGKFTETSEFALRPDIETTSNASSFLTVEDEELFPGNKYLTIFDEFSLDTHGYITLGNSKLVSSDGLVQYSRPGNTTISIATSSANRGTIPIVVDNTTYLSTTDKSNGESSNSANLSTTKSYYTDNNTVPFKISTSTTTDGRLVNTMALGPKASQYWITDADVVGQYTTDTKTSTVSDVISTVNSASTSGRETTNTLITDKQDSVLAYISKQGVISYTSKEEGIAVKVITDSEGALILDPRKIWDNRKLRPVVITFKKEPTDINSLEGDPITFYRVSEDEIALDYKKNTWRNMVTRAQVTYEIEKKGQEPFIQIISGTREPDVKSWKLVDGKLVEYIKRESTQKIDTTYINRKPIVVRSNCPFRLNFKYNSGFENTLAFDDVVKVMKSYRLTSGAQILNSDIYDASYGQDIYFNLLEADLTGEIGTIVATYKNFTTSSKIISNSFTGYNTANLVKVDGTIDNDALNRIVLIERGLAKNIYASSRRTLHNTFTAFMSSKDGATEYSSDYSDYDDYDGNGTSTTTSTSVFDTKDTVREAITKTKSLNGLVISAPTPYFDEEGYVSHKVTLDISSQDSPRRYPVNSLGKLSIFPYNSKRQYDTNSSNAAHLYLYESGIAPKVTIKSYPGILGGFVDRSEGSSSIEREYTAASITGKVYSFSAWIPEELQTRLINGSDSKLFVPVRWQDTQSDKVYYTLPGAEVKIEGDKYVPTYTGAGTPDLDSSFLFSCFENPILWSKVDMSKVSASTVNSVTTLTSNSPSIYLDEVYMATTGSYVNTTTKLYKVGVKNEIWEVDPDSEITQDTADYVTNLITGISENTMMVDNGTTVFIKAATTGGKNKVYVRVRKDITLGNGTIVRYPHTTTNELKNCIKSYGELKLITVKNDTSKNPQRKTEIRKFFTDVKGNYYIENTKTLRYPFVYKNTDLLLSDIRYAVREDNTVLDSKTTFIVESNYRLQYVHLGKDEDNGETIVVDTPTKVFPLGQLPQEDPDGENCLNVPYEKLTTKFHKNDTRVNRAKAYSKALDIDIHVLPEYIGSGGDRKPLFKIESITENPLTSGKYEYTIMLAPKQEYNEDGKRFCGKVVISSRVRKVIDDSSTNVPKELLDAYPVVLPLYENGLQVPGKTRSADPEDFSYELSTLKSMQSKINTIIPPFEVSVDVYQQKLNFVQLIGDRTREVRNGETRKFSTMYQPNMEYYDPETDDIVRLNSDTIRLFGKNTGWSSMNKSTKKYIAEIYNINTLLNHLPASTGTYTSIKVGNKVTYKLITPGDIYCVENLTSGETTYYSVALPKMVMQGSTPIARWIQVDPNDLWDEEQDDSSTNRDKCLGKVTITKETDINNLLSPLLNLKSGDIYKVTTTNTEGQTNEFFEYLPTDLANKVTIKSNNYNPNTTNKSGLPYTLVSFNNIFSSYYPSNINSNNIQNGSILSEYKNGSTRDHLINFNIDLGYWIDKGGDLGMSVETRDYFKKSDNVDDKMVFDGITYIKWYKYEKERDVDVKLDYYNLLLPENIDTEEGTSIFGAVVSLIEVEDSEEVREVNGISLDEPLPEKYYLVEMKDGDTDVNYFTDIKGRFLVKYDKDTGKLYGTSENSGGYRYIWENVKSNLYQECISFIQPGVNFGLVCATSTNNPRLYLSDNSDKNTITETIGSTSTYIDFMAGTFNLTSDSMSYETIDMSDRFRKEGTMMMNSITVANRDEYFQKRYKQSTEVTLDISGVKYSIWDRYVIDQEGEYVLNNEYSYLLNKKYDNPVLIGEKSYNSSLERLNVDNPDPNFRYLYPDYIIDSNNEIIVENKENINKPFVDYKIVNDIPRLFVSGDIEYDRWVKYELSNDGTKYIRYSGYEVLMDKNTDYRSISLKNPKHADYTVRSDGDSKGNYFNERGEVFVKYEFSHSDYIERTDDTPINISGNSYEVWAKYEYSTTTNKYELQENYKYLFPRRADGLPDRDSSGLYSPSYVVIYDGDGNIDQRYPTDKTFDEMLETDGKIRIYEEGAVIDEYLYKTSDGGYLAKGTTDLSITCIDNVTKDSDWNYEILNETAFVDYDKSYLNNIRINFPQNTTENDITRIFRLDSKEDNGGVIHSVILRVKHTGFLGSVYCDPSINFTSTGNYIGKYVQVDGLDEKQVDNYFYFDTDVPISELEFKINDENASVILSKGDNTDSYYGPDFKRYRLSIKLSDNLTRARKRLSLEIIRNYNVYKNNIVSRKFKTLKKVNLVQGYRALYIESPYYNQKTLNGKKTDLHTELLRLLNPNGIVATKEDPLIVPFSQSIMYDEVTGMNYTIPLHYEFFEPTIEDGFKDELKKVYSAEELIEMLNELPSNWLKFDWKIEYPNEATPSMLFDSYKVTCIKDIGNSLRWKIDNTVTRDSASYLVSESIEELSKNELDNLVIGETLWVDSDGIGYVLVGILNTPFLYMEYDVKDSYLTTGIRSYLTIIMTLGDGTSYRFYVNMKKSTK